MTVFKVNVCPIDLKEYMLTTESNNKKNLPDIAKSTKGDLAIALDRVGMTAVELPLHLVVNEQKVTVPARADMFVNLADAKAKGIHMSRLFLEAQDSFEKNTLNIALVKKILTHFISSHKGLSTSAQLRLRFELLVLRPALLSDYAGWRSYPVEIDTKLEDGEFNISVGLEVLYSSTCPCSAALSRQLIQEHFKNAFKDKTIDVDTVHDWLGKSENIVATPHSQRSEAKVKLRLDNEIENFDFVKFIDLLEQSLATPVQTAVKREDEQEFARLNASNLMFCEDAARKLHSALNNEDSIVDFWLQ
ncbi:MAG: GTP cyclohydrolase I FolE2, partial [Bdellovibrionales bacterium]|nr:GTP cyclohydrolase I FolE2 [Bdellovibrionales bacterium]